MDAGTKPSSERTICILSCYYISPALHSLLVGKGCEIDAIFGNKFGKTNYKLI